MHQYFLSVLCFGMLCGFCQSMVSGSGEIEKTMKAISGAVLILVCISPMLDYQDLSVGSISEMIQIETQAAISEGVELREKAISESIKDRTLSYIEGIAVEEKASIAAEIEVKGGELRKIFLSGEVTPNTRRRITQRLSGDFKLEEGSIQWIP